jgi:hypothetical protein
MSDETAARETAKRSSRLTPLESKRDLRPWVRAPGLTHLFLYWMPVSGFPVPDFQRLWLLEFLNRFSDLLSKKHELRAEVFLKFKLIYPDLLDLFLKTSREFYPMLGLGRQPDAQLPPIPKIEDLQALIDGREQFDFGKYMGDYCYWFLNKCEKRQREVFLGNGATLTLFLKRDKATTAPKLPFTPELRAKSEVLRKLDPDRLIGRAFALKDMFLAESKRVFGGGLEHEAQFKALLFVVPILKSQDFFSEPPEESGKWFQVFDIYINESPVDRGILMAFKSDFEEDLIALLETMRGEGLLYPES